MQRLNTNRNERRSGLTLVELVVVLMILIALAGVLIPTVTDMVGRSHTSAGSANMSQITGAIGRYEAQYMLYPNNLDSLVSDLSAGTHLNTLDDELQSGGDHELVAVSLGSSIDEATAFESLQSAGITSVGLHTAGSATFDMATPTALVNSHSLLGLSAAHQVDLGLEIIGVANKYVCLGIGNISSMIGKTMAEAPVHFPESGTEGPNVVYNRFIAVFDVSGERAKLAKVISPHGTAIDAVMQEYFESAADN